MYSFSPKLKLYSIILIVVGLVLFGIGYMLNHGLDDSAIKTMMEGVHHGKNTAMHSSELIGPQDEAAHLEHAKHLVHNTPYSALLTASMLFFGISACALFFLSIQHAAHAGWSVIVQRVMEAVASFIPVGGLLLLILTFLNAGGVAHLYHWMDPELTNPDSPKFDVIIYEKSKFLNVPFYVVRVLIYVIGASFFVWKIKKLSKKLDETKARADYKSLYNWSVGYIAFFGFASAAWAWDFLMSIDPHWYSTLYIWYSMVSTLSSAVAVIILVAVHLKKKGVLPQFNDNHLHDLAKFLFATSLLWTYLWFDQFMLYWYANIPEEVRYFFDRFAFYKYTFLPMLIINFLLPLLVLVSSSIKRNYKVVTTMAVLVILGHWLDFFNMVMPGTIGAYWTNAYTALLTIGAFLFVVGLFTFVVMSALTKLKLIPTGNPLVKESEIYEYPF